MIRLTRLTCLAAGLLCSPAYALDAYEVAAWAPADAVAVLAWAGADNVQGFGESHLGGLWAEPSIKRFLTRPATSGWELLREKIAEELTPERADLILGSMGEAWSRPGMLCLFKTEPEKAWPVPVGCFVRWQVSDSARTRADALVKWMEEEKGSPLTSKTIGGVSWVQVDPDGVVFLSLEDEYWMLAISEQAATRAGAIGKSPGFATNPMNKRAQAALEAQRSFYYSCVNTNAVREMVIRAAADMMASRKGSQSDVSTFQMAALAALVFAGAGTFGSQEFATAIAFDGPWLHQTNYARSDEQHPVPFDMIRNRPLDRAWLADVPGDVISAQVLTWEPRSIYLNALEAIEAGWTEAVSKVPGTKPAGPGDLRERVREAIGLDPQDLFETLGEQAAILQRPGVGIPTILAVLELRDAEGLREQVQRLLARLPEGLTFRTRSVGEHTIHVLDLEQMIAFGAMVSPSYAITRDRLVIGLQEAGVAQYLQHRTATQPAGPPLVDSEAVAKFLAGHKSGELAALGYVNEAEAVMPLYTQLSMFYPMFTAEIMKAEPRMRFGTLPMPGDIEAHLVESVSWTTVNGPVRIHHERAGLPIVTSGMSIAKLALGMSVMLPSLARARELSKRTVCAANLKGIGLALHTHADGNEGKFPPDLKTLVDAAAVSEKQFICPSGDPDPDNPANCYVYIDGQTTGSDVRNVLVYEKPDCHGGEGANVLFLDAHVEWVTPSERVEELVRATRERLQRP